MFNFVLHSLEVRLEGCAGSPLAGTLFLPEPAPEEPPLRPDEEDAEALLPAAQKKRRPRHKKAPGLLTRALDDPRPLFRYDPQWLSRGFALGWDLPLSPAVQRPARNQEVFEFLKARAPSSANRLVPQESPVSEKPGLLNASAEAVFAAHRTHHPGGIALLNPAGREAAGFSGDIPRAVSGAGLDELVYAMHAIERGRGSPGDRALAGASARMPGEGRLCLIEEDGRSKLFRMQLQRDVIAIPLWRELLLKFARVCGIETVASDLRRHLGSPVLITERFDRSIPENQPLDPSPLVTLPSDALLETPSYLAMADLLTSDGAAPAEDLPMMWRRMAFSLMTGGSDDPDRWHFIREPFGWRLAPAHGFTLPVEPSPRGMTREGRTRLKSPEESLEIARYFGVRTPEAKLILAEMRKIRTGLARMAYALGIEPREISRVLGTFGD